MFGNESAGLTQDLVFSMNNKAFPAGAVVAATPDGIKYRDNVTLATDWTNYAPAIKGTGSPIVVSRRMTGARLAIEFKGRLLFFGVWEATDNGAGVLGASVQYDNRMRYSWLFDITDQTNSFLEASGKGGFFDAPTTQAIITLQFVKDRLVVYFERSTYELVYTGSPDQPFVWQALDATLGAESTFSEVPFDDVVIGVGPNGIHACNGATVKRIDDKIPDVVFETLNLYSDNREALSSIAGIRDYFKEYVYWTFPPSNENDLLFSNKMLCYDYKYKAWSFLDDSYTALGYHTRISAFFWSNWNDLWLESSKPWSYSKSIQRNTLIIMGNQQGYISQIQYDTSGTLIPCLTITNLDTVSLPGFTVIYSVNHNFQAGEFVRIEGCLGSTNLNDTNYKIFSIVDSNHFSIPAVADPGYTGGGLLERVPNVEVTTKQFNFFTNTGQQTLIPYIEFLVDRTGQLGENGQPAFGGKHVVDFKVGSSNLSMIYSSSANGAILGTNILETAPYPNNYLEATQDRLWHRVYFQVTNDFVQFELYYNEDQMLDDIIPFTSFVMHAMLIYADARGSQISS